MDDTTIIYLFNQTTTLWQKQDNVNHAMLDLFIDQGEKLILHDYCILLLCFALLLIVAANLILWKKIRRYKNEKKIA